MFLTLHDCVYLEYEEVNDPSKQKELKAFLLRIKIDIFSCLEVRVKQHKAKKIIAKITDMDYCNYEHAYNGRIYLMWKRDIDVLIIEKGGDFIHCKVARGNICFIFTVVYGTDDLSVREELWRKFGLMGSRVQEPWLLCGDFNNVLYSDDRLNGSEVTQQETKGLLECLHLLNLTSLRAKGWYYTWCNKQEASQRIYILR